MPPIESQIWPLVIIGRGSSAAYYVCSVDLNLYKHVLAIGDGDPWAGARGHHGDSTDPTRTLNHPLQLVEHFRRTVPRFSETMVDRLEWAKMNEEVLKECNVQVHDAKVKMVAESKFPNTIPGGELGPTGYKIDLDKGGPVYAYKVVMAAGAGGHRLPPELKDWAPKFPGQIINIDEFAKLGPKELTPTTHVIVWGPNAAIDAVQKAIHYKCKISWLVDKPIKSLPILATQPTVRQAVDKDPSWILKYSSVPEVTGQAGGRVRVKVNVEGSGTRFLDGDYYVFGLGQGGEPLSAIDAAIKSKMEPIFDKNLYLGGGSGTILGYQAVGTGLQKGFEVVGAMTAQVGRDRSKVIDDLKKQLKDMRSIDWFFQAITTAGFPDKIVPFLLKDAEFLASQPRDPLARQLQTEAKFVASKYRSLDGLPLALDSLVSLILAYHASKNYASLINQATSHLPKGTVGDGGQLTTIKAAMAAKHGTVPKSAPGQTYKGHGAGSKSTTWVDVQSKPGEVNFNTDNATMLQIGLCQIYPLISDDDLNTWIGKLMSKRKASAKGFDQIEVSRFHQELTQLNNQTVNQLRKQ
jgi:hypothetical protein